MTNENSHCSQILALRFTRVVCGWDVAGGFQGSEHCQLVSDPAKGEAVKSVIRVPAGTHVPSCQRCLVCPPLLPPVTEATAPGVQGILQS